MSNAQPRTNVPAVVNAAANAASKGAAANASMLTAQNNLTKGNAVSTNLTRLNSSSNKTVTNYNRAAMNLRKANMNRAANSFENAAKKAAVGDGVGAAKSAGAGLRSMIKTANNLR